MIQLGHLPLRSQRPSFENGYARNKSESAYPHLWDSLIGAWCPSIGFQGRKLIDFSGRGNHGAFVSGMGQDAWVKTIHGPALQYDGTDDSVSVGVSLVNLNSDFTVVARFQMNSIAGNSNTIFGVSVAGDVSQSYHLCKYRNDRSGLTWQSDTGPGSAVYPASASANCVANRWHHAAWVRSRSQAAFALALDGQNIIGDSTNPNFTNTTGQDYNIGCMTSAGAAERFAGIIGDVFLFNRLMRDRERVQMFEGAHPLTLAADRSSMIYYQQPAPVVGSPGQMMLLGVGG